MRAKGTSSKKWRKPSKEASEEEDPETEASGDVDTVDLLDQEDDEAVTSMYEERGSDDDDDDDEEGGHDEEEVQ